MHHLCPYPSGPVRIDPHPLTFSDTRCIFHPLCRARCVSVQTRGCLYFSVFSSLLLANLSTGLRSAGQIHTEEFLELYFVVAQIKGQTFLLEFEM